MAVHQNGEREFSDFHFFEGVPFASIPHATVALLGQRGGIKFVQIDDLSNEPFVWELAWMFGRENGVLALFMFLAEEEELSLVRVSHDRTSYVDLAFPDIEVYVPCWTESHLLPVKNFRLANLTRTLPVAISGERFARKKCVEEKKRGK